MESAFATVVLVAAGNSTRMGSGDRSKVLMPLAGATLIEHTMRAFAEASTVWDCVVVARPEDFEALTAIARAVDLPVHAMVPGGKERFDSVCAGCRAMQP
ncbi:MAG: 2-C-methyl-D-erythritol 4-phosphate cytidylyltransferase, partial [Planctomycetes bacterium]|nr:2-C-methyl-D-erythritol 4-phosphate cytidylyltransferase [Planctomycetota bacterium]